MHIRDIAKDLPAVDANDIRVNGATQAQIHELRERFNACGCLVIENVFVPEYIDYVKNHFDMRYASIPQDVMDAQYYKVGDRRYQFTLHMEHPFDDPVIYANPIICGICSAFLSEHFLLDSYVAVLSRSGAQHQNIHRDCPPLFESAQLSESLPPYALTVIIPLVDIDTACGSTALWPGSHKKLSGLASQVAGEPEQPVVKRGAVYLWDYRLTHAGQANHTQTDRPILSLVYSRRWFSDTTNFFKEPPIHLNREQYEKIPQHAKQLFDRFLWTMEK